MRFHCNHTHTPNMGRVGWGGIGNGHHVHGAILEWDTSKQFKVTLASCFQAETASDSASLYQKLY